MVPFAGHPAVVGIEPGQSELVVLAAVDWALAVGASALHFAYVDPDRVVVAEGRDGSVRHEGLEPDAADDGWRDTEADLRARLAALLDPTGVRWAFHYLAGRPDRALTHLARAVDASVFIVGARHPGAARRIAELFAGSLAAHLAQHQHRPVLTIPIAVVDWADPSDEWAK
ncbi:universal stress protein [Agromyces sp. MMS17-SY077]|uniref:Universal stress protein n=2 Tax=Agromyces seonyuensis TaxID=2662446 RepID=A0A6I4NYX8_9MICO|nr:universal stress protein [Agromyces seonyuensis]MWB99478.1 universal stress protein [Agromyces seonyuensis]